MEQLRHLKSKFSVKQKRQVVAWVDLAELLRLDNLFQQISRYQKGAVPCASADWSVRIEWVGLTSDQREFKVTELSLWCMFQTGYRRSRRSMEASKGLNHKLQQRKSLSASRVWYFRSNSCEKRSPKLSFLCLYDHYRMTPRRMLNLCKPISAVRKKKFISHNLNTDWDYEIKSCNINREWEKNQNLELNNPFEWQEKCLQE